MLGIVVSRADEASEHVAEHLLELGEWDRSVDDDRADGDGGGTVYRSGPFELRTFEELHLRLEGVAEAFDDPGLVAFASSHSGDTGPLLTAHFTGNVGVAEFGGEDHELALAAPAALDRVVDAFHDHAPAGYDVGIECTHHGPSEVGVPSLFVELGSEESEWRDPEGAEAVARSILALADLVGAADDVAGAADDVAGAADDVAAAAGRTLVGFGSGHYAPRFARIRDETGWQLGHVAADWALADLDDPDDHRPVLRQVFERSDAELALVDGSDPDLEATIEDLGYRVVSETWLREVDGVALPLVERAEDALGPVAEGTRFGEPASDVGETPLDDLSVATLPDKLLSAALGIDGERTRSVVAETLVAYQTEEGGTRPQGDALLREGDVDDLVDRLVSILATDYDDVERAGGTVVAREEGFDPDLAREHGVPAGPKFGRLADGQPVEVDGETVAPEDVTAERVERFELP